MHFVIPKLHHMWSTRFCIIVLFINHQIMLRFLCLLFSCVWERENGFKDSQENSHVQEPTAASFNQILSLGHYSAISLSFFSCRIHSHFTTSFFHHFHSLSLIKFIYFISFWSFFFFVCIFCSSHKSTLSLSLSDWPNVFVFMQPPKTSVLLDVSNCIQSLKQKLQELKVATAHYDPMPKVRESQKEGETNFIRDG